MQKVLLSLILLVAEFHSKAGMPVGDKPLFINSNHVYADSKDSNTFYYAPRIQLAKNPDSTFQFAFLKITNKSNGSIKQGIVHVIYELGLNDSIIQTIRNELEKKYANRNIILKQLPILNNSYQPLNRLQVISSVLLPNQNKMMEGVGENKFAFSIKLDSAQCIFLDESFKSGTGDLRPVVPECYFSATKKYYDGNVFTKVDDLYKYFTASKDTTKWTSAALKSKVITLIQNRKIQFNFSVFNQYEDGLENQLINLFMLKLIDMAFIQHPITDEAINKSEQGNFYYTLKKKKDISMSVLDFNHSEDMSYYSHITIADIPVKIPYNDIYFKTVELENEAFELPAGK